MTENLGAPLTAVDESVPGVAPLGESPNPPTASAAVPVPVPAQPAVLPPPAVAPAVVAPTFDALAAVAPVIDAHVPAAPMPAQPAPEPESVPVAAPVADSDRDEFAPAAGLIAAGPSAIFSAGAAIMSPDHATPVIPVNTPAMPSAPAPTTASTFDVADFLDSSNTERKKQQAKPRGRWLKRLVLVALLGAGGWAAYEYGPALYEQYVANETDPTETDPTGATPTEATPTGAAAPLAFPNVPAVSAAPIRTAEFILVGVPETPGSTYRVTTDFETDVSQVDVERVSGPDLQILTYGDDAMIRRTDGTQWYLVDRGQFPLDGRLDRADWVRRLDELLPLEVRDQATIDASTESTISGVPTRHLTLTLDPALLDAAAVAVAGEDTGTEPVPAPEPQAAAETAISVASPPEGAQAPAEATTMSLEVWIDGDGLIRQVSGAPQLGAATITVVRTDSEAWVPSYPSQEEIAPLTASALVDLGL